MKEKILMEICCGSADDVIQAEKGGADRVELNSDLFHGGLTPTLGTLIAAKRHTKIPVMVMIRPRQGGFCYTDVEFEVMLEDARLMLENGAEGIVFGFLHQDGTVDKERCARMMEVIGEKESVFHRAIDVVPDWKSALDVLIELGVTRVLTSGQEANVLTGAETVKEMREYTAGRIEILPGAGIRPANVEKVLALTGCNQFHSSASGTAYDTSTANSRGIFFGGALYPPEDHFSVTNSQVVSQYCEMIK